MSELMEHAKKRPPSGADRWMVCGPSVAMEWGEGQDEGNSYSDEGTAAHFLAAFCLGNGAVPVNYLDRKLVVGMLGNGWTEVRFSEDSHTGDFAPRRTFEIDLDFAAHVNIYVQEIRRLTEPGAEAHIEQRVPIGHMTREEGAEGTADYIAFSADRTRLDVHDFKFGFKPVCAERNRQGLHYASGALRRFDLADEVETIRIYIHQPRIPGYKAPEMYELTRAELEEFEKEVRLAAADSEAWLLRVQQGEEVPLDAFVATEDGCRYCLAKAKCPGFKAAVLSTVGTEGCPVEDFEDLEAIVRPAAGEGPLVPRDPEGLARAFKAIPLIEMWCSAIREEAERALLVRGETVPDLKLVQGKQGNRAWQDEDEAEKALRSFKLKNEDLYTKKLISPTQAEKIYGEKGVAPSPVRWKKLEAMITRNPGKVSVALASDPRPEYKPVNVAKDFDDETGDDLC